MRLAHVLITRFSHRPRPDAGMPGWFHNGDPLVPARLLARFRLFEMLCLPAVRGQTTRDFTWVIVVDPLLAETWRRRLAELTRVHVPTIILDYSPSMDLRTLGWLVPYLPPGTTHVATTNLDDDDVLHPGFLEAIQVHLHERDRSGSLPSWQIVGSTHAVQWDLLPSRDAPLGYLKPWHPGVIPSAGYTFCGRYPGPDVSVLFLRHLVAYADPATVDPDPALARLRALAEASGEDWRAWSPAERLHLLDPPAALVMMGNHLESDTLARLFEAWSTRTAVRSEADFPPGLAPPLAVVRTHIDSFRRSPAALARHLAQGLRSLVSHGERTPGAAARARRALLVLTMPLWFLTGLPGFYTRRRAGRRGRLSGTG